MCRLLALVLCTAGVVQSADWITAPSYYTHDQGQRVQQYAEIGPFYYRDQGDYTQSGLRYTASVIRYGGGVDSYRTIEEWGNGFDVLRGRLYRPRVYVPWNVRPYPLQMERWHGDFRDSPW